MVPIFCPQLLLTGPGGRRCPLRELRPELAVSPRPHSGELGAARGPPPRAGRLQLLGRFPPQSRGLWARSRRFTFAGPWGKSRPAQVGRAGSKSTGSMRRTFWIRAEPSESHAPGFRARLSPVLALRLETPGRHMATQTASGCGLGRTFVTAAHLPAWGRCHSHPRASSAQGQGRNSPCHVR